LNAPNVMKTTANLEYCMDKLYTQFYTNWVRNVENNSTLSTFTSLSTIHLTMPRF